MADINNYTLNKETGCFEWGGHLDKDGYGTLYVDGVTQKAHRYFYEQKNGVIADNMVLDHLCKNCKCVNTAHLEVVTQQENVQRGNSAKLNKYEVTTIKQMYSEGHKQTYIASLFGVGQDQISRIINNKRWQNV